ncbi:MAG: NADH-quinone oxidoreductase subunit NuoB [bacterium]|nr:NADH-quinone oxidoreductase subunit NuoB [bacterium]
MLDNASRVLNEWLERPLDWAQQKSLWPQVFGIACCSLEMMDFGASRTDADRHGIFYRATPRQCDVLIVPGGPVTLKMAQVVRAVYEQMPRPRFAVAMGACTITGGIFRGSYNIIDRLDQIIPVDVYIPGCPPRPEAIMFAMMKLQEKIQREGR